MITLNDIKDRLMIVPKKVATNIKRKVLTWVISDVAKTWVGKVYRLEEMPDGTFHEVEIGKNSVLLGGLEQLALLLYHIPFKIAIGSFEDDLYATADKDERPRITHDEDAFPFIQGFNVAHDGIASGIDLRPVARHKKGYGPNLEGLIPFRVIPESENDFAVYRPKYLHHRKITIGGKPYIAYYTKKCQISYEALLDNDQKIPQNPDTNLVTDRDSRLIAEFTLNLEEDELVEFFRLTMKGGAEATNFSAILTMCGQPAKWSPESAPETSYDTMINSVVFSRANTSPINKNSSFSAIITKYRMMHI